MSLPGLNLAVQSSAILHQNNQLYPNPLQISTPWKKLFSTIKTSRLRPATQDIQDFYHLLWNNTAGFFYYTLKRFYNDNCFQMASSLTYAILLALVPLMTIGFAIFSAFPVFAELKSQAQDILFSNLVPGVGVKVQEYLNNFMENASGLTTFGVVGLTFSAILLLSTIETSFSTIWRISEPRHLVMRFLSFWTVLTFSPLLFAMALSLPGVFMTTIETQFLVFFPFIQSLTYIPVVFEFLGFTLIYLIIPNRSIHWFDAIRGGLLATLVFEVSKRGFVWYIQTFPVYETIYGALSTIPIFLIWMYIFWCTVLLGAVTTAAIPEWRSMKLTPDNVFELSYMSRMAVALAILYHLFLANRNGIRLQQRHIIEYTKVGAILIEELLLQLSKSGWLARTAQKDLWILTRDLATSTLYDLEKALGLGIQGSVDTLKGIDQAFKGYLTQLFNHLQQQHHTTMNINLAELFIAQNIQSILPPSKRISDLTTHKTSIP